MSDVLSVRSRGIDAGARYVARALDQFEETATSGIAMAGSLGLVIDNAAITILDEDDNVAFQVNPQGLTMTGPFLSKGDSSSVGIAERYVLQGEYKRADGTPYEIYAREQSILFEGKDKYDFTPSSSRIAAQYSAYSYFLPPLAVQQSTSPNEQGYNSPFFVGASLHFTAQETGNIDGTPWSTGHLLLSGDSLAYSYVKRNPNGDILDASDVNFFSIEPQRMRFHAEKEFHASGTNYARMSVGEPFSSSHQGIVVGTGTSDPADSTVEGSGIRFSNYEALLAFRGDGGTSSLRVTDTQVALSSSGRMNVNAASGIFVDASSGLHVSSNGEQVSFEVDDSKLYVNSDGLMYGLGDFNNPTGAPYAHLTDDAAQLSFYHGSANETIALSTSGTRIDSTDFDLYAHAGDASVVSLTGQAYIQASTDIVLNSKRLVAYGIKSTTSSFSSVVQGGDGTLYVTSSRSELKLDQELVPLDHAKAMFSIDPLTWRDRDEVEANPDTTERYAGFTVNNVAEVSESNGGALEPIIIRNEEGHLASLDYSRMPDPYTVVMVNELASRVEALEAALSVSTSAP